MRLTSTCTIIERQPDKCRLLNSFPRVSKLVAKKANDIGEC